MTNDIEQKEIVKPTTDKPAFSIDLIFKTEEPGKKLGNEERQLLRACINEILGEIEIEEKRIIEEERKAALEITANRHDNQENTSCK